MVKKNGGSLIRVLVSATSAVRRAGLESLLSSLPIVKVMGGVYGLNSLARHAQELQADIVVLDLERDDPEVLESVSELREKISIITLIDEQGTEWSAQALRNGVRAILPRDCAPEELLWAIQAAHSGFVLLDAATSENLARNVRPEFTEFAVEIDQLTPREIEVLRLLADGVGNKEIASRLGISDHTVKFHISSILDKLGAASRTEAVTLGIRTGLILL